MGKNNKKKHVLQSAIAINTILLKLMSELYDIKSIEELESLLNKTECKLEKYFEHIINYNFFSSKSSLSKINTCFDEFKIDNVTSFICKN